jgi:fluoride exporter
MDRGIILVGLGGMIGSVLRYLVALLFMRQGTQGFPYGTLAVNLAGCFLIGIILALSEKGDLIGTEWRLMLATGFCGGFTTFSAFSFESIRLLQDGEISLVSLYVGSSVIAGLLLTYLGMQIVRAV